MSVRTQDEILRFPDQGDNTLTPNQHNYVWNDDDTGANQDGLRIGNNSFTTENAVIRVAVLSAIKTTATDANDGFIMDNSTIIFDGDVNERGDDTTVANIQGTNRFRNCTFLRNETEAGANQRIILGNFADTHRDATTLELSNCRFIATDNPFAILNFGIGDFQFANNALIGAVGGQFYQGFVSVGNVWPGIGANDGGTGVFAGSNYYARAIHQDINSDNNNQGNDLPDFNAIFFIGDDVSVSAANNVGPQFNDNGAMIKVNNLTGGLAENPSFHRTPSVANSAAAYSIVGWKPEFTDGENAVADVMMRFNHVSYRVSAFGNDVQAALATIRGTRVTPQLDVVANMGAADYRGFWLLTNVERWTDLNATAIPIPANSSFRAWSFTHDLTLNGRTDLQSANVNIPTTAVTNANGAADTRLGSVSMGADDFVNDQYVVTADALIGTYTATTAPAPGDEVSTLDDAYAALRRSWYDGSVLEEFTIGDVANSRLTLGRNTNLSNADTTYDLTTHNINSSGLVVGSLITGVNATGAVVGLDNRAFPSGAGEVRCEINGGTWRDPSDAQMVDFISNAVIQLSNPSNLDWRSWDFNVLNNSDLSVVNLTGAELTIFVTPAQFALLGSPADTTGAGGILYVQLVTPFAFEFRNQALFDTDGTGIDGFLAIRRRRHPLEAWEEVPAYPGVVIVRDGDSRTLTVANEPQADSERQYLLIWRPIDVRYETSFQVFDLTGVNFPTTQAAEPYTINATRIPDVLLPAGLEEAGYLDTSETPDTEGYVISTTGATAAEIARVTWRLGAVSATEGGDGGMEIVGTITGTNLSALNGASTQLLMRTAYLDQDYIDLLVDRGLDTDIITVSSDITTLADGQYVQLTTGDGTQQQITGLEPRDLDGDGRTDLVNNLQAVISGTIDGVPDASAGNVISFPAVNIIDNPEGISAAQVRNSLINDLQAINSNVVVSSVKPAAVQTAQGGNVQI